MKLLGKEVKVGVRVRTVYTLGTIIRIEERHDYPVRRKKDKGAEYTVTPDGLYRKGSIDVSYDVIEVLDNEPTTEDSSDAHTIELELKNYRLSLENELLAQEVQELRKRLEEYKQAVKELAGKLADLLLKGTPYE